MAPFVAQTVAEHWVRDALVGNATVLTEVGGEGNIWPRVGPAAVKSRHLTHGIGGLVLNAVVAPQRGPIGMVTLFWDVTAWEPSLSQQSIEPLVEASMTALIGDATSGRQSVFVHRSRRFAVDCDYYGPEAVPDDVAAAGAWTPIRQRYVIRVRPS